MAQTMLIAVGAGLQNIRTQGKRGVHSSKAFIGNSHGKILYKKHVQSMLGNHFLGLVSLHFCCIDLTKTTQNPGLILWL